MDRLALAQKFLAPQAKKMTRLSPFDPVLLLVISFVPFNPVGTKEVIGKRDKQRRAELVNGFLVIIHSTTSELRAG